MQKNSSKEKRSPKKIQANQRKKKRRKLLKRKRRRRIKSQLQINLMNRWKQISQRFQRLQIRRTKKKKRNLSGWAMKR